MYLISCGRELSLSRLPDAFKQAIHTREQVRYQQGLENAMAVRELWEMAKGVTAYLEFYQNGPPGTEKAGSVKDHKGIAEAYVTERRKQ